MKTNANTTLRIPVFASLSLLSSSGALSILYPYRPMKIIATKKAADFRNANTKRITLFSTRLRTHSSQVTPSILPKSNAELNIQNAKKKSAAPYNTYNKLSFDFFTSSSLSL